MNSPASIGNLLVQKQPTGWLCPKCNGAHGPHVETCPALLPAVSPGLPQSPSAGLPGTPVPGPGCLPVYHYSPGPR